MFGWELGAWPAAAQTHMFETCVLKGSMNLEVTQTKSEMTGWQIAPWLVSDERKGQAAVPSL
jgi:hypothetical protein